MSIAGAAKAIEFYKQAFGAIELFRLTTPAGDIGHAEIKIGDSPIMPADPCEEGSFRNPQTLGGSSIASTSMSMTLTLYSRGRSLPAHPL